MKVEIWSDIVCPFCYIGKRKFEKALDNFGQKDKVEIVWRSFQLDADLKQVPGQSVHEYLALRKGVSTEKGKEMNDYMTAAAKEVGLAYDFDNAIINNTLNAHRLSHLAAKYGLQNEAEEALFAAYYTQGKDIGDIDVLTAIGVSVGLSATDIKSMFATDAFVDAVRKDQDTAQQVGVQGVPFYVFNNKYAVSGAQPTEVFKQVLDKVWEEEKPDAVVESVGFCSTDGECN
jgi:predicted DsbA family dithiol-disulfide isomerase